MEWKDKISTFKQIDVRGIQGNFFQGLKKQAMQLPAGSGLEIVQSFDPIPLYEVMSLVDPDRFEGALRTSNQSIDISDVMRRLVKEDLLKFDGTPLFPERIAYTVNYDLSDAEAKLYTAVTSYVQDEFRKTTIFCFPHMRRTA